MSVESALRCGDCARFRKNIRNTTGECHLNNGRLWGGVPVSHIRHAYDKACKKFKERT